MSEAEIRMRQWAAEDPNAEDITPEDFAAVIAELEAARERERLLEALPNERSLADQLRICEAELEAAREALQEIVNLTVIQRKPGTQAAREIAAAALDAPREEG